MLIFGFTFSTKGLELASRVFYLCPMVSKLPTIRAFKQYLY